MIGNNDRYQRHFSNALVKPFIMKCLCKGTLTFGLYISNQESFSTEWHRNSP